MLPEAKAAIWQAANCNAERPDSTGARHIEVQIIGDGQAGSGHLGERDCTLQGVTRNC